MTVRVRIEPNQAGLRELLHSRNGGAARAVLRTGLRVESKAKQRVKADHGRLRQSINHDLTIRSGVPVCRVGTNVYYAPWVHNGTGIWGPHHSPIVPTRAKVLKFTGRNGRIIFRPSTEGQRPNRFLQDALNNARH